MALKEITTIKKDCYKSGRPKTAGIEEYTTSVRMGRTMEEIAEDLKKN